MSMIHIISSPLELRTLCEQIRLQGKTIGLVPTLGGLHQGHLSLMHQARKENDIVITSIFVNPLQFGPNEDFHAYPRQLQQDCSLCEETGVDIIFAPAQDALYFDDRTTSLDGGILSTLHCGKSRPTHFNGVITIVHILLQLAQAHRAYFGEKDFQQLFLVKRMVRDLWLPTEIVPMPTIREADGLAMSSRNVYLSPNEREIAPCLFKAILATQDAVAKGEKKIKNLRTIAQKYMTRPEVRIDYIEFVEPDTLLPFFDETVLERSARILLAAYVGKKPARLIDNALITL